MEAYSKEASCLPTWSVAQATDEDGAKMTMTKLVAAMAVCAGAGVLWGGGPAQNAARVREIAAMLPKEPGFPSVRADARDFWRLAPASAVADGISHSVRK